MRKISDVGDGRVAFLCPGCGMTHELGISNPESCIWGFNGDYEKPTFTPSVLATGSKPSDDPTEFDDYTKDVKYVCHSFVIDGQIQFLSDCTHALAGKTVPLPEWDQKWGF